MAREYTYYPGCSMHSSGKDFEESLQAVCRHLDINLVELPDWNCCGASATHITDPEVGYELSLRNLVMAEQLAKRDIVTACAACYAHLKHSEHEALERGSGKMGTFKGDIKARNLLDVIHEDVGLDEVEKNVKIKLEGLKPVGYYGCLMVRPPEICELDDAEDPVFIDDIMASIGADPVFWTYKTDCCGGSLSVPRSDVVIDLVGKLFEHAIEAGANCIVTACPLCHVNLDSRQEQAGQKLGKTINLPVYYYTELMGISFGIQEYPTWLGRHFVDALPLIESVLKAAPTAG